MLNTFRPPFSSAMGIPYVTRIFWLLLQSITFLRFSLGTNSLYSNQTIGIGDTLVSQNQIFEMGFFSPGRSHNRFLGIWYKDTPDVVVWVANRNTPIADSQDLRLAIVGNESLVIKTAAGVLWTSDPTRGVALNPVLQLLDTGNLVLADTWDDQDFCIWQSFDHPTDTWLPGMNMTDDPDTGVQKYVQSWQSPDDPSPGEFTFKLENHGLPELVLLKGANKIYRSGKFNGLHFNGGPRISKDIFSPLMVFREEIMVSIWEAFDSTIVKRLKLEEGGKLFIYKMNAQRNKWNNAYTNKRDLCDQYNECGPNAICRIHKVVRCECFKGYAPRFKKDWDLQDWSGGCTRIVPLDCNGNDGFQEVRQVNIPNVVPMQFRLNTSMSLNECRAECLKNCSCVAFTNPYKNRGDRGCAMWFGDLIDTRDLIQNYQELNIYIRLPRSQLDAEAKLEHKRQKWQIKIILISVISGVLVSGLIKGIIIRSTRKKEVEKKGEVFELPLFKLAAIVAATNNFSEENILGEGGFGPVYKGKLSPVDEIAVKRLSRDSAQGLEELKTEVMLVAKLQHRNLVRLLGCCIDGEERMLIYEYLPNKSLDNFIFDENKRTLLTWSKRFDIIIGIARGLLYLHRDSRLRIIHRDLKTSNILLDENLNPKISDFGLARIIGENQCMTKTKRVVGTYGYMSPEYAIAGKFSVKSDIFSFGVLLLEIVSGRKNRGFDNYDPYRNLLGHAWLLWKEDNTLELMDECLSSTFIESQVKKCVHVGLLCAQRNAKDRPDMSYIYSMLTTDGVAMPEPKEPGFFIPESAIAIKNCTFKAGIKSDKQTITITDLEGR